MTPLFTPFTFPNGRTIRNRVVKAAMEENLADAGQVPGAALINLYEAWSRGGAGMLITGNVMIDPTAMTGPGGVVLQHGTLEDDATRKRFTDWAAAARHDGSKCVMQISHPGRQIFAAQGTPPVSASATKVSMPGLESMFDQARALTGDEIRGLIRRFAETAFAAQRAGFDGVQIHAAHGYLLAQFLSPLTNLREDEWGGSIENRARFLINVIRAVRARVDADFILGVKLNSADFQRGGFDVADATQVVGMLNELAVDFVEISGGNYESSAMMGNSEDGRLDSTARREIYFLDFARDIAKTAHMPLMVTGGITKKATAEAALESGAVELIGLARGLAFNPNLPEDWRLARADDVHINSANWKNKGMAALANMALTKAQLVRMSEGKSVKTRQNAVLATIAQQMRNRRQTTRYKKWLASLNEL